MHKILGSLMVIAWIFSGRITAAATEQPDILSLRRDANSGDAGAEIALGELYWRGESVENNKAEAIQWWQKAAQHGSEVAEANLGYAYHLGQGTKTDQVEAVKWWLKAGLQGEPSAEISLGYAYHSGKGVIKNDAEALKWWLAAAKQGVKNAQIMVGVAYGDGWGVQRDKIEADTWLCLGTSDRGWGELELTTWFYKVTTEIGMSSDQRAEAQRRATKWKEFLFVTQTKANPTRTTNQDPGSDTVEVTPAVSETSSK